MTRQPLIGTIAFLIVGCLEPVQQGSEPSPPNDTFSMQEELGLPADSTDIGPPVDQLDEPSETKLGKEDMDYGGTYEVRVTLEQLDILDPALHRQLDSLIKWEKECLGRPLKDLSWIFTQGPSNTYQLTAISGFGGTYLGYTHADSSLVLIAPDLPIEIKMTGKKEPFVFLNPKVPHTKDYSVWLFRTDEQKQMRIVQSYALPCDRRPLPPPVDSTR